MASFLRRYGRSDLRMLPTLGTTWLLVTVFSVGYLAAMKVLPFKAAEIVLSLAFGCVLAAVSVITARTALRTIGNDEESWVQRTVAILVLVLLGAALKAFVS